MSVAKKAGLLVGIIGVAATIASAAEGGEGGRGRKVFVPYYVEGPPVVYYGPQVVAPPPVVVYQPPPTYVPVYPGPEPGVNLNFTIPLR
jgi:hypothetical protein